MDYKISDFQMQLKNTLNNIHHPDAGASKLVEAFIVSEPTSDNFNKLLDSLQEVSYSSPKTQANFSPINNLLITQHLHLLTQDLANKYASINNEVAPSAMECLGSKKSGFSLQAIDSCKEFSKTVTGGHYVYLTLTGDVKDCQGPYSDGATAFYHCEMGS
jgi:hypothetical protein